LNADGLYPKAEADAVGTGVFFDGWLIIGKGNGAGLCGLKERSVVLVVFDVIFEEALILGDLMVVDGGQQAFAA
jgi:hypothetical protein